MKKFTRRQEGGPYQSIHDPSARKDERDVNDHIDQGSPIYVIVRNLVVLHDDIRDDGKLNPLESVDHRHKYKNA